MFKKLKLCFDDDVIKKCIYLTNIIDRCKILDHNPLSLYKFIDYPKDSEEAYVIKKFTEKLKSQPSFGYDHKIIDFPWKKIIDYLPSELLEYEVPTVRWQKFAAKSIIAPHVDLDRQCTINLYLSVSDEKTIFYNKKRNGIKLQTVDNHITNENYIDEWLDEYDSFIAEKFDMYLLNVTQPHSVVNTKDVDRISLQFSFKKTSYNVVKTIVN